MRNQPLFGCQEISAPAQGIHFNLKDLTNCAFGKVTVLGRDLESQSRHVYWRCRCICGIEKSIRGGHLNAGKVKSCGCSKNIVHGMHKSREYKSWEMMIQRCYNENYESYKWYGARGISVCDRWRGKGGFQNFFADMGLRPMGLSIERVDNEKGYEPGNCTWATQTEQMLNTRRSIKNRALR